MHDMSNDFVDNELDLDETVAALQALAKEKRIPLSTAIELTMKCNLRCLHCYNFDRDKPDPNEREELKTDEILHLIDELAAEGCLFLCLTGGESLMHPDILPIIKHARKNYMAVTVRTSGALLNERILKKLIDLGVANFGVSLYGTTAEVHDHFTQNPGAFDATIKAVKLSTQLGSRCDVNFGLTKYNVHQIADVPTMGQSLKSYISITTHITTRFDGSDSSVDHRASREDLEKLYAGPLSRMVSSCNPKAAEDADSRLEEFYLCGCARNVCGINAYGDVLPCVGVPMGCGNIREQSFHEIWKNSVQLNRIRGLTLEDFPVCNECAIRPFCQRANSVSYVDAGDYTGPEPFTCAQAEIIQEQYSGEFIAAAGSNLSRD